MNQGHSTLESNSNENKMFGHNNQVHYMYDAIKSQQISIHEHVYIGFLINNTQYINIFNASYVYMYMLNG